MSQETELVWYVGYGSNLSFERFRYYLQGGRPAGAARDYPGARDRTLPRASMTTSIPHRLFFAGESTVWTGGMAFLEAIGSDTSTLGRGHLITLQQLEDVMRQENGGLEATVDLSVLRQQGSALASQGKYGLALYLGEHEGHPMVTFTSPIPDLLSRATAPAPGYLRVIATGIREISRMSSEAIVRYLGAAPGCSTELARRAVTGHERKGTTREVA